MRRRIAVSVGAGFAFAGLAAACATSGGDASTHGPVFDLDSGSSLGDSPLASDATQPQTPHDGSFPDDAHELLDAMNAGDTGGSDDAGLDSAPTGVTDSGDAASDCTSVAVVLAGSASSLSGAVAIGTGVFTVDSVTGSAALAPGLVATSTGFEALVATSTDAGGGYALAGLGYANGSWSALATLGAGASAIDAPALALLGSDVEAAYLNPQHLYFHAEWSGTSWNAGTDPVTPSGGVQSFGPVRASAAATTTELVIAYEGNDSHLYAQSWTSAGGWQTAVEVGGVDAGATLATNTPPVIVALTPGGTDDFLVVYDAPENPPSEQHIYYALRMASTKAWSVPAEISSSIYSPNAPSLAPMSGGRALLGWRGGNQQPYTAEYDPTGGGSWTTAVGIGSSTVAAPPSLAAGTCGDDALVAILSGGAVSVVRYASGAWQAPVAIAGISGASVAAIATSP